jgi:hypothetical protein
VAYSAFLCTIEQTVYPKTSTVHTAWNSIDANQTQIIQINESKQYPGRHQGETMRLKNLFLGSIFVGAAMSVALIAPLALQAQPVPQAVSVKVYDRNHKDYHVWDDHEDHAYAQYRVEHPAVKVEFKKANKKQQGDYWNWRHAHPDHN